MRKFYWVISTFFSIFPFFFFSLFFFLFTLLSCLAACFVLLLFVKKERVFCAFGSVLGERFGCCFGIFQVFWGFAFGYVPFCFAGCMVVRIFGLVKP